MSETHTRTHTQAWLSPILDRLVKLLGTGDHMCIIVPFDLETTFKRLV